MSPTVRIDLSSLVSRQMYFIFLIFLFLQWLDNAEKKVSGLQPIATSVSGIKVREWKALRWSRSKSGRLSERATPLCLLFQTFFPTPFFLHPLLTTFSLPPPVSNGRELGFARRL